MIGGVVLTKAFSYAFGRHSGYGGYGSWARGSRAIIIEEYGKKVTTHVRMENGTIIHEGILK